MFSNMFKKGELVWVCGNTSTYNSGFVILEVKVEEIVLDLTTGEYVYRLRTTDDILVVNKQSCIYPTLKICVEHLKEELKKIENCHQQNEVYINRIKRAISEKEGRD